MGRRKPRFNFFDAFCGSFVIVGGGCFGEPVKDGAQDLFLSGGAVVQAARRPRSCHLVVAVLRLWVITLGALPGALHVGGVFGLLHGVSGMVGPAELLANGGSKRTAAADELRLPLGTGINMTTPPRTSPPVRIWPAAGWMAQNATGRPAEAMRRRDAPAACVVASPMCRGAASDCPANGAVSAPSRWAGEHRHREAGAHPVSGGSSSWWLLSGAGGANCRLAGPAWAGAISRERRAQVVIGAIARVAQPAVQRRTATDRHSLNATANL